MEINGPNVSPSALLGTGLNDEMPRIRPARGAVFLFGQRRAAPCRAGSCLLRDVRERNGGKDGPVRGP